MKLCSFVLTPETKDVENPPKTAAGPALPCLPGGEGFRGDDLYFDGQAVPNRLIFRTVCTACPGKVLLSCDLLAILPATDKLLNIHKRQT
jgi:hypothetical protein